MRNYFKIISATISVILVLLISCQSNKKLNDINKEINYVFFLHNKFLEDNPDGTDLWFLVKKEKQKPMESNTLRK